MRPHGEEFRAGWPQGSNPLGPPGPELTILNPRARGWWGKKSWYRRLGDAKQAKTPGESRWLWGKELSTPHGGPGKQGKCQQRTRLREVWNLLDLADPGWIPLGTGVARIEGGGEEVQPGKRDAQWA